MDKSEIWPTIHQERARLAADLEGLAPARWDTPSLCEEWTVRDVVAHLTATARISTFGFFPRFFASGFNLPRMQRKDIAVERGSSPEDTLARFRSQISATTHPPGPADTWLGEIVVHGGDIRLPLGIPHDPSIGALVRVADMYKGSNMIIGTKRRISGLALSATDADWSHGEGQKVRGPLAYLVMAMAGRTSAIDHLSGEGVAKLRSRD